VRVLHIHSGNLYGGVETVISTVARFRDACPKMESYFALCFEGRLSGELCAAGATVYALGRVRVSSPLSVRRVRLALGELLQRERFDIAVCHSAWSQAIFGRSVRAARLPLVLWLHAATDGRHWLERWARRTPPDAVICNSRFTAATLPRLYPNVHAEVIYCPVAPPPSVSPDEKTRVREELNTPENATVIIQVSRMEPGKGQAMHLKALSHLRDISHWVCWIVGGSQSEDERSYEVELKAEAQRLGITTRVRFTGQRRDVPRLLAAADIYCQPNVSPDSFGLTFAEALHARLPVVTTAIGGALEIVDASCGLLVSVGDEHGLAVALRSLLEDSALRANLGTNGPTHVMGLCDPKSRLQKLENVLASLA
jgi:glycosyltransferase involved in cell wall biosynthesis